EAAGPPIVDLTRSNPTAVGLPVVEGVLAALADPRAARYRPAPLGLDSAREAIAAFMTRQGTPTDASSVVVTASTSEAYGLLFKLLCDAGDDVMVPAPSYPLFEHLARFEHVAPAPYPLAYDGRWHVTAADLRAARTARTRAVLAVHPNNPTGSYLKADELEALAALGLPLISDEVFSPYPLDDLAEIPTARVARGPLVFSLHGLSKLACLPQLKLSWICVSGPDGLVDEALQRLELIADAYLSVAGPVQLALPAILDASAPVTRATHERLRRNLRTMRAQCAGSPVDALHVEGGWYAVLRLPVTRDDESWALRLLRDDGVLVQPGYFYDFDGGPYAVLSLITPPDELDRGLEALLARVSDDL
ncbi:MAG: pyridoxal phosphate-dependent aminotransferase, partial [Myxococcales bacterium]